MSLFKQVVKEMAAGATGAGAIGNVRGSLFGGGVIDLKKATRRQRRLMKRVMNYTVIEGLDISQDETNFDPADVISKIDAAEKKAKNEKDTVTFGLEDEDDNLVKVYVKADQAEEFERTLASLLAGEDDNDDEKNSATEIATVLFKLKDKFEIIDVEWPNIEGDEEEEQEVSAVETETDDQNMDIADDEMASGKEGDIDLDLENPEDDMTSDEDAAKSALQQVIDMLKSDAEARSAEAKAKEAEAKAKEAEFAARTAEAKIKQEEEVLDMETYYKQKSDQEKEAKQLAKLAKYKHDKANDAESQLSFETATEEDEEELDDKDEKSISLDELTNLIFTNLRAN